MRVGALSLRPLAPLVMLCVMDLAKIESRLIELASAQADLSPLELARLMLCLTREVLLIKRDTQQLSPDRYASSRPLVDAVAKQRVT